MVLSSSTPGGLSESEPKSLSILLNEAGESRTFKPLEGSHTGAACAEAPWLCCLMDADASRLVSLRGPASNTACDAAPALLFDDRVVAVALGA